MIPKEKFMEWLNEPNSQPLSLKQFKRPTASKGFPKPYCWSYLKAELKNSGDEKLMRLNIYNKEKQA